MVEQPSRFRIYQAEKTDGKEITGYVKLQIKGGQANPAPPVGPALGQRGINMEFVKPSMKKQSFHG